MWNLESSFHLFWTCTISVSIWNQAAHWKGCFFFCGNTGVICAKAGQLGGRKQHHCNCLCDHKPHHPSSTKRGIKSMIILIYWEIWQERNNYTFRGKKYIWKRCDKGCQNKLGAMSPCRGQSHGEAFFPSFFSYFPILWSIYHLLDLVNLCLMPFWSILCLDLVNLWRLSN